LELTNAAAASSLARGPKLDSKPPGAREFDKLARTDCLRQTVTILSNASPADIMRQVLGIDPREGLSPMSIGSGVAFESGLLRDNAGPLLAMYREKGRLSVSDVGVINTADVVPAKHPARSQERANLTQQILRAKLRGRSTYTLVLKPLFPVDVAGRMYFIEPDYLVASARDPMFRVGEIKSFYDLDALTEEEDWRSALRQSAVNFLALWDTIRFFGVGGAQLKKLVPPRVDLVLRRVGTRRPSLREESVRREAESVLRAYRSFPARLKEADAALAASGLTTSDLTDERVINALPPTFDPRCRNFCAFYLTAYLKSGIGFARPSR
jgi:hypothetical protein